MAVALALPRHDASDADVPHLGPASASDGGTAHISEHTGLWYSVRPDDRACPWCNLPIDDLRCVAIMPDGAWRWAHRLCAVQAKGGKSDMAIGAPWKRRERPLCARCGGRWGTADGGGDHVHAHGGVWCDDECSIAYEESVSA